MSTKNLVLSTEDLERLNQIIAHYQVHLDDQERLAFSKLRTHDSGETTTPSLQFDTALSNLRPNTEP